MDYGIRQLPARTAGWRGFQAGYDVADEGVCPHQLSVFGPDEPQKLFGRTAVNPDGGMFSGVYKDLKHPLRFIGSLLLARGFIRELNVHRDSNRPGNTKWPTSCSSKRRADRGCGPVRRCRAARENACRSAKARDRLIEGGDRGVDAQDLRTGYDF